VSLKNCLDPLSEINERIALPEALFQQAACQPSGNGINGHAKALSLAACS
jgi:hypothetical protein